MIKKVMALVATALFSVNASAGYVRYDFNGPIHGYFVQHDDDQSIAYYNFNVPLSGLPQAFNFMVYPIFGEGADAITSESTYFHNNGPTNFTIFDDFGADKYLGLSVNFSRSTGGTFAYTAKYGGSVYMAPLEGSRFYSTAGTLSGTVFIGAMDPNMARGLDELGGYYDGVPVITPQYIGPGKVPEPGSLALIALGAVGALSATRRRKNPG